MGNIEQVLVSQPSQARFLEDLERRVNPLFDALNCETLSEGVVEKLVQLTNGTLCSSVDSKQES